MSSYFNAPISVHELAVSSSPAPRGPAKAAFIIRANLAKRAKRTEADDPTRPINCPDSSIAPSAEL